MGEGRIGKVVMSEWIKLRNQCPKLYKHGIAFECGPGWLDLLCDLSTKIERILEKDEETYKTAASEEDEYVEMFAIQVKEKYGTLRFYMSCATDEIGKFIDEAEALSERTYETCGAPAELRGGHWLEVRCDGCFKEEK
jgi:hypothetical protein